MSSTTTPFAGTYAADPIHSSFGFAVRYQGVSLFRGTLNEVTATLADGRLEGAAKVESISIRTPEQFRAHVLSAEFFDAANHPEVTFSSSSLDLREDGTAEVDGELTIKGITRPISGVGRYAAPRMSSFGEIAGLQLRTSFDRREFGFDWQMELPGGGNAVGWDVEVDIDLLLILEPADDQG